MRRNRFRRLIALAVLSAAAIGVPEAQAQAKDNIRPKAIASIPDPTTVGNFAGTWTRQEPGWQQVIQLKRDAAGTGWELTFRWQIEGGVAIDTNWQPRHEFRYEGFPGVFELTLDRARSTDDQLILNYRRDQQGAKGTRLLETGEVRLYRTGEGSHLAWVQDPLDMKITFDEPLTPDEEAGRVRQQRRVWQFAQQSSRLLEPDEIQW